MYFMASSFWNGRPEDERRTRKWTASRRLGAGRTVPWLAADHAQVPIRAEQHGPPQIRAPARSAAPQELLRVDLGRAHRRRLGHQPQRLAREERNRGLHQLDLESGPPGVAEILVREVHVL